MKYTHGLGIALTIALLAFASGAMAGEHAAACDERITLVGHLWVDSDEQFVLTDAESGEMISLRGSEEQLAKYSDSNVRVTGTWAKDDAGKKFFRVDSVEPIES